MGHLDIRNGDKDQYIVVWIEAEPGESSPLGFAACDSFVHTVKEEPGSSHRLRKCFSQVKLQGQGRHFTIYFDMGS